MEWTEADDAVIADIVATTRARQSRRDLRPRTRCGRSLAFWAPSRFVSSAGIDVDGFVAELDATIRTRGMVLYDRQIVTTPLADAEWIETIVEPEGEYEVPARTEWGQAQRSYFGLDDPYQMADDPDAFTWSHVVIGLPEPYLRSDEFIAGLLHGEQDRRYLECPCHSASVVYTTRHRLLCMSCGMTHLVLAGPLPLTPPRLLTAEEWIAFFDDDGDRRDEEVDVEIIDFREVEDAPSIWKTDQWADAAHELIFFARSTPQDIERAIRGTELDPSGLIEAGWRKVDLPPPPAFQLLPNSVDVDLLDNAAYALSDGVADFVSAYVRPERLVSAIPDLFRSVELLLKARLQLADDHALHDHPNNPTVVNRLTAHSVILSSGEADTVFRLRRLRNDLQHGTAAFNQRGGLSLCRKAIVFVDRFVHDELKLWIGDVIIGHAWRHLLSIGEIAARAERVAMERLLPYRTDADAEITECASCNHEAMFRPHPATGASCAYCGAIPVYDERQEGHHLDQEGVRNARRTGGETGRD